MVERVMTTASMILTGACSFHSIHLFSELKRSRVAFKNPPNFQLISAPDATLFDQCREPPTRVVGRYGFHAIRSSHLCVAARCMCHRRHRHDAHRHQHTCIDCGSASRVCRRALISNQLTKARPVGLGGIRAMYLRRDRSVTQIVVAVVVPVRVVPSSPGLHRLPPWPGSNRLSALEPHVHVPAPAPVLTILARARACACARPARVDMWCRRDSSLRVGVHAEPVWGQRPCDASRPVTSHLHTTATHAAARK
jgi:hypothetical protein